MNLALNQNEIALLSKAVLEGVSYDKSLNLSDNVKFLVGTILSTGVAEDLTQLPTEQRVIKAFKLLHDEKSETQALTDDQFRYVRRAVGNGNYEKVFALLGTYWRSAGSEAQKQIAEAAKILAV